MKKDMDQEWSTEDCGTTLNWVDLEDRGNVFIHLKEGVVVQIDASTPRFQTQGRLATHATPGQVRKQYSGLRAYILSDSFLRGRNVPWMSGLRRLV